MPDGSRPRVVSLTENVSLVVADVPADTYSKDAIEARLKDLDWVARCGAAHHAVADQLAPKHTVVPFRLFTLFSSEDRALSTLGRMARRIDEALERVKGRAEWVLRISRPDPAVMAEVVAQARPSAASQKAARPLSGTSFLAAKAAAKQAAAEVALRVRSGAAAVLEALEAISDQSNQRPIEPATGLLLDAAFLVPARRAAEFKEALSREAAGLLRDGCRVSLTGPWPPYSFVDLETARG
jgi:hypothetical protein